MSTQRDANLNVVRRWVDEVFNQHQLESVEHLKVPDYVDWNPYPGQDIALAGFKAVLASWTKAFPDFRYDVDEELAEGDIVVCIGKWYGTHTEQYMGMPPTGTKLSARRIDIVRLAGDKMTERWGTGNELQMLKFLGVAKPAVALDRADGPEGVLRRFVTEVLENKNLASIDELVDQDARGTATEMITFIALSAVLDGMTASIDQLSVDGDRVSSTLSIRGVFAREFWDTAPDGEPIEVQGALSARLNGGKIVELDLDLPLEPIAVRLGLPADLLSSATTTVAPTGSPGDGRFVLRSFVQDVLNQHRLHKVSGLVVDRARDYLQESLTTAALFAAFPDHQFNIERVVIDGQRVTVLATFAGTHRGAFLGIEPSGRGVTTRSISLFTVEDGKITDLIFNFDLHTLLTQLGAFPDAGTFGATAG
ncbi:ester cyclase [Saccharopolyspora cebuensis]|uniref:Ester cyclase n=1 Tax=Saccharopolyspora cebuensis TaxID=418759 RepID=A0ABV4CP71_9PSEU